MNNYQKDNKKNVQFQVLANKILNDKSSGFDKNNLENNSEKKNLKDIEKINRKIKLSKALRDNLKRRKNS